MTPTEPPDRIRAGRGLAPAASARLGYVTQRLSRAMTRATEVIASKRGITVSEYMMLLVLSDGIGRSNAELARRTFVSAQAAHIVLSDLETRGLLERREHAKNKRVRIATLTAEGRRVFSSCLDDMIAVEQRIFAPLSEQQAATLLQGLNDSADALAGGYFGDRDEERAAEARRKKDG